VTAGVAVGLLLCEWGFRLRDQGAFPHLNVYVPDAALGVRLRPGARERVRVANNAPTEVRINDAGLRGGPLGPPSDKRDEILVVGDSQVFGLGVEEEETFSAALARATKRPVVNAGVPTYGPEEYNRLLEELLPERKPGVVVWTVNLANDLFEAAHPNIERHAVWDGWAVRKETAPSSVTRFPGRELFFRDSHLVFAWRRFLSERRARAARRADSSEIAELRPAAARDPVLEGTASEGSWRDLVGAGEKSRAERARAEAEEERARGEKVKALVEARGSLRALELQLDKVMQEVIPDEEAGAGLLRASVADPGDIVRVTYAEGARPIRATAQEIARAAETRRKLEAALKERHDAASLEKLSQFDALAARVKGLSAEANREKVVRARSPLAAHLARAKALAAEHGARLVVLVLPLDVMVSAEEWKKYGAAPIDMSATRVLVDDVVASAQELAALAVDATPALAAAEPGAFLDGDLHMTPKGHAAVAAALAKALDKKGADPARPQQRAAAQQRAGASPAVRAERSEMPKPWELERAEWRDADTGCRWQRVREWVRLRCKRAAIEVTRPGRGEALTLTLRDWGILTAALDEGDQLEGRIVDGRGERRFVASWPLADEEPWITVNSARPLRGPAPAGPSAQELALCACQEKLGGACGELYGGADPACAARWGESCAQLLACARGDRGFAPTCAAGQSRAGGPPWCR
jgi:hypothetical protein